MWQDFFEDRGNQKLGRHLRFLRRAPLLGLVEREFCALQIGRKRHDDMDCAMIENAPIPATNVSLLSSCFLFVSPFFSAVVPRFESRVFIEN